MIFAKHGEQLMCEQCETPLSQSAVLEVGTNHDCEDYWCDPCTDFVGVKVVSL